MKLRFEPLEERRLLASDWQQAVNHLDVDGSGIVTPIDVLHVFNSLNKDGVYTFPAKPAGYDGVYCDVNGDNQLTPLDALPIINALNKYTQSLDLQIDLTPESDLDRNQIVLRPQAEYAGTTLPDLSIAVTLVADDGTQTLLKEVASNATGDFRFSIDLQQPINYLRFEVSDPLGRVLSTERIVRVGDVILDWNASLIEVVRETTNQLSTGILLKPPPPMVARYLAMTHIAMHDAVNAVTGEYGSYALQVARQPNASPEVAAAVAAYDVVSTFYHEPSQMAIWDQTLQETLAAIPDGDAKSIGTTLGHQAAAAILALRANDNSDGANYSGPYSAGDEPGDWHPTAPSFSPATLPYWSSVTPFAMTSASQFRPVAPPSIHSAEYAAAVDEVMRLGEDKSSTRTADQTEIANFWADGGGTATPPGHWNLIAADVGMSQHNALTQNAYSLALLNIALADAGIAAWDAKYEYGYWRPIDAIRQADFDQNDATIAEVDWTPLLNTPSFPTYTSGHSTFSGAAAAVLDAIYGSDVAFTAYADPGSTGAWPPSKDVSGLAARSFDNFSDAADEAGLSRIYGGIHYSFDNTAGLTSGRQLGEMVANTLLQA